MQRYVYLREFLAAMDQKSNEAWYRDQGLAEGLAKGELKSLYSQIQKKFQKGKTLAETAGELEDTEERLQSLYEAAAQHPEFTAEQLADWFMEEQKKK